MSVKVLDSVIAFDAPTVIVPAFSSVLLNSSRPDPAVMLPVEAATATAPENVACPEPPVRAPVPLIFKAWKPAVVPSARDPLELISNCPAECVNVFVSAMAVASVFVPAALRITA